MQKFLECIDEFSESQIDEEEESLESPDKASYKNMIDGQEIIDLKTNHTPRVLVPLERIRLLGFPHISSLTGTGIRLLGLIYHKESQLIVGIHIQPSLDFGYFLKDVLHILYQQ